jgi:hypothetical protein
METADKTCIETVSEGRYVSDSRRGEQFRFARSFVGLCKLLPVVTYIAISVLLLRVTTSSEMEMEGHPFFFYGPMMYPGRAVFDGSGYSCGEVGLTELLRMVFDGRGSLTYRPLIDLLLWCVGLLLLLALGILSGRRRKTVLWLTIAFWIGTAIDNAIAVGLACL